MKDDAVINEFASAKLKAENMESAPGRFSNPEGGKREGHKEVDFMLHQWRGASTERKPESATKYQNPELVKSRRDQKEATLLVAENAMKTPPKRLPAGPGNKKSPWASLPKLKITDIVKEAALKSKDPNTWLYQGNLLRYRPGFSDNYIPKWCTISRSTFAYYRDKWAANCFLENPLVAIPIARIKSVKRVLLEIPDEKKKGQKPKQMKFQFEIILHDTTGFEGGSFHQQQNAAADEEATAPKDGPPVKVEDIAGVDPSSSFYGMQEGHLMRSPYQIQSSVMHDVSTVSVRKDKHEHQWSERQIEWYVSENRFLFVAETAAELQKWLILFQWVLSQHA